VHILSVHGKQDLSPSPYAFSPIAPFTSSPLREPGPVETDVDVERLLKLTQLYAEIPEI